MNDNLRTRPCAICGESSPESFRIFFDGYLKLYRCLTCGFVSQYPGPGRYTIVEAYEDYYSLSFLNKNQEFMYPRRQRGLEDIVGRVSAFKPAGRLLDVGCGDGFFLSLAQKKGFECWGVEESKQLAGYAASKSGARISRGRYSGEMFPKSHFDIITFIQVVEHMPAPREALRIANYHLRPHGLLVIEVPSLHSPHFLLYQWTGIKRFVRPPDGIIQCHFGYYTPRTLEELTKKAGFQKLVLTTGRWQYKYNGALGEVGKIIDPILNALGVGGILYIGTKRESTA